MTHWILVVFLIGPSKTAALSVPDWRTEAECRAAGEIVTNSRRVSVEAVCIKQIKTKESSGAYSHR